MRTFHLTFNLEADGAWYIDFPGYPFAHHNLMMVAGADSLCQYIAEKEGHPEKAVVDVTTGNNFLQSRMPDITMERFDKGYGASYHNHIPDGSAPKVVRNSFFSSGANWLISYSISQLTGMHWAPCSAAMALTVW